MVRRSSSFDRPASDSRACHSGLVQSLSDPKPFVVRYPALTHCMSVIRLKIGAISRWYSVLGRLRLPARTSEEKAVS